MPAIAHKDACTLLDADHLAVKHLFVDYARIATATPQDASRRDIAMTICEELTVHAQIEEEIFYPALRAALPDADDLLQEAESEHAQVKEMVQSIQGMGEAGEEMDRLVAELARCVEHHVKEERDELFTKARASGKVDLESMGDQLRDRQQQLRAQ